MKLNQCLVGITPLFIYEALMVVGSVLGSILLALNIEYSKYGYLLFLIGSVFGLITSIIIKKKSFMFMNFYFTLVNILGVIRWVL